MVHPLAKGLVAGGLIGSARIRRRRPTPAPRSASNETAGVAVWIIMGILLSLLDVPWMLLFWPLSFFVFSGVLWLVCTWAIAIAGICEARQNRIPK
jgi:hypothetical protein